MLRRECRRRSRPPCRGTVPRSRRVNTSSHVARTSTASGRQLERRAARRGQVHAWIARSRCGRRASRPRMRPSTIRTSRSSTPGADRRDPVAPPSRSGRAGRRPVAARRSPVARSRATGQAAWYAMAPSTCSTRPMASHSEHGVGFASWSGPRSSSWPRDPEDLGVPLDGRVLAHVRTSPFLRRQTTLCVRARRKKGLELSRRGVEGGGGHRDEQPRAGGGRRARCGSRTPSSRGRTACTVAQPRA